MNKKDYLISLSIIILLLFTLYIFSIMGYEIKICGITSSGQLFFCIF